MLLHVFIIVGLTSQEKVVEGDGAKRMWKRASATGPLGEVEVSKSLLCIFWATNLSPPPSLSRTQHYTHYTHRSIVVNVEH